MCITLADITIIQPRHNYAPIDPNVEGHIYSCTSGWTAGCMLEGTQKINVAYHDQNLKPGLGEKSRFVGVSLLGAPYIPEAIKIQSQLPEGTKFIVGGKVVDGLHRVDESGKVIDRSQFDKLFGNDAVIGTNKFELAKAFGIQANEILEPENTSLIPAYQKIPDQDMKKYMQTEMSFYLSQGCKYACDFCTADRTQVTLNADGTKNAKTINERYRQIPVIESDLEYLVERAKNLGLNKLNFYLSNLDLFQTPLGLVQFTKTINRIKAKHPDFEIKFRALATVKEFIKLHDKKHGPKIIQELIDAGLHTVGFGVDGWGKELWDSINKGHNKAKDCIRAIKIAKENYGLTPELLMVFGHEKDTPKTMQAALRVAEAMIKKHGAIIRPHLTKNVLPGNDHWFKLENQGQVDFLLNNPRFFQALDFTARASSISHPNPDHRRIVNEGYDKMLALKSNETKAVEPIDPELSEAENQNRILGNIGNYDH